MIELPGLSCCALTSQGGIPIPGQRKGKTWLFKHFSQGFKQNIICFMHSCVQLMRQELYLSPWLSNSDGHFGLDQKEKHPKCIYLFIYRLWHWQTNGGIKALLIGVELAIDVLQPFLGGQGFMSPWREGVSDSTKLFYFSSSSNQEVDGEHQSVNLIGKMKGSLRIPCLPSFSPWSARTLCWR